MEAAQGSGASVLPAPGAARLAGMDSGGAFTDSQQLRTADTTIADRFEDAERASLLRSGDLDSTTGTPRLGGDRATTGAAGALRQWASGLRAGSGSRQQSAPHQLQEQPTGSLLVDHPSVLPTESRKLAGLQDLGLCALVLVPYLLMKVFRCGHPVGRPPPHPLARAAAV